MAIRYEVEAENDLRQVVLDGLAKGLPDPINFVQQLRARIATLATLPASGRVGRIAGTREWALPGTPYVVVYIERTTVDVLRILHSRQQHADLSAQ